MQATIRYRSGHLPLGKLIARRYQLADVNEALDDLEQHRVARCPLLELDGSIG